MEKHSERVLMYHYIVNPNAGNRAIDSIQDKLKERLHKLDIDGEFFKTLEKGDAGNIALSGLKQGAKTIVVIGGDKTLNEVISAVHSSNSPRTPIGVIPTGNSNQLAGMLGISDWQQAVELLAVRRLHQFRLIHINDHHFIHQAEFIPQSDEEWEFLAEINGQYRIRGTGDSVTVHNLRRLHPHLTDRLFFETSQPAKAKRWWQFGSDPAVNKGSQLHASSMNIEFSQSTNAMIDGRRISDVSYHLYLSDMPVRLITNKMG